jgi:hypothetical protein
VTWYKIIREGGGGFHQLALSPNLPLAQTAGQTLAKQPEARLAAVKSSSGHPLVQVTARSFSEAALFVGLHCGDDNGL